MTIERNAPWGSALPDSVIGVAIDVSDTDADAAAALFRHHEAGTEAVVRLRGGELRRSLGGGQRSTDIGDDRDEQPSTWRYPVDLGLVEWDSGRCAFLASFVVHAPTWRDGTAYMNAQTVGRLRLGHRAHPNDGVLDRVQWRLRLRELPLVVQRARLGAHTPHPAISERRVSTDEIVVARFARCIADGRRLAARPGTTIRISVLPDAGFVTVDREPPSTQV